MTDEIANAFRPYRLRGFATNQDLEHGRRFGPLRTRPYYAGSHRGIAFYSLTKFVNNELYVTRRPVLAIGVGLDGIRAAIDAEFKALASSSTSRRGVPA